MSRGVLRLALACALPMPVNSLLLMSAQLKHTASGKVHAGR